MQAVNVLTLLLFTGLNSTFKLSDVHSANANESVAPSTYAVSHLPPWPVSRGARGGAARPYPPISEVTCSAKSRESRAGLTATSVSRNISSSAPESAA